MAQELVSIDLHVQHCTNPLDNAAYAVYAPFSPFGFSAHVYIKRGIVTSMVPHYSFQLNFDQPPHFGYSIVNTYFSQYPDSLPQFSLKVMAFRPKQITQYQAEHLAELQGDVSVTAFEYSLGLLPAFVDGDNIHDNAAGSGAVTATIFEQLKPDTSIHVNATDKNEQFVQGCKALAESKGWPVDATVMLAQELTYPDNNFTHSFTSFAFHCLGDHDAAAKQVYRTLKPDGIAVASIWISMPHVDALQHAHWRTRGKRGSHACAFASRKLPRAGPAQCSPGWWFRAHRLLHEGLLPKCTRCQAMGSAGMELLGYLAHRLGPDRRGEMG
ncbi:unnamed protein product [Periconia digitata]|uniref:Methyltransferase type 11 domain-containing protein n=1 Tax=Periconia digitata TaxID=1303443 RepID=A0A9W4XQZ9_9PLEO|nr:unnamed protein product [Periconia digitata]